MAVIFNTTNSQFFTSYDSFTNATPNLSGNNGDDLRFKEVLEVTIIFNELNTVSVTLDEAAEKFGAPGINFITQGFSSGTTIQIDWIDTGDNVTPRSLSGVNVGNITNIGYQDLYTDAAGIAAIVALDSGLPAASGLTTNLTFTFRQETPPTAARYSYGINTNSSTGVSFQSPFDNNDQKYATNDTTSTSPLFFMGGEEGSSLGEVTLEFLGTTLGYVHEFEIEHNFKVAYYVDGEITNLQTAVNPANYLSGESVRYDHRIEFGTPSVQNSVFTSQGQQGNYGYVSENFNGLQNNYSLSNISISNASNTGVIEVTEVNTVTFDLTSTGGNWTAGVDTAIAGHSRLLTAAQYANQTTPFDDLWFYENLEATEGAVAASGTIITDYSITITSPTVMRCEFKIDYSSAQQVTLVGGEGYYLFLSVAHNNLNNPTIVDKVTLVIDANNYTENTDVSGLIEPTSHKITIFPSFDILTQTSGATTLQPGIGDLQWAKCSVDVVVADSPRIEALNWRIVAFNSTTNDEFILLDYSIPLGLPLINVPIGGGGASYQLLNIDTVGNLNLPTNDVLNRIIVTADVPGTLPNPIQRVNITLGFQTRWQEWIANLAVNTAFYDTAEANNNLNFRTSNYSALNGYEVFGRLDFSMGNSVQTVPTIYRRWTTPSPILDFDSASWTGASAATNLFDDNNDPTTNIFESENVRIEIECTHTFGTIALSELEGEMWIEEDQGVGSPFYLSTYRDWTNSVSPLQPTDTLLTGNTTLVEVVSVNNLVTLICQTNRFNLTAGISYTPYGRFWLK